jgi:DNA-binding MarR family transcriptional regulator
MASGGRERDPGRPARAAAPTRPARGAARYSEAGAAVYQLLQELDRVEPIWGRSDVSRGRLAVLRILAVDGPQTASDVARARHTSRQGVQRLVSALEGEAWIEILPNPRHRRAPLLHLTAAGVAAYQRLAAEEAARLNELARGLKPDDVRAAWRVIQALRIRGAATPT